MKTNNNSPISNQSTNQTFDDPMGVPLLAIPKTSRVIIIDDNLSIHGDFRSILSPAPIESLLSQVESNLFDDRDTVELPQPKYRLSFASQGKEGVEKIVAARTASDPFSLAFVDMRMPPGWDGLQTIAKIFELDTEIQVVICTAYSDHSWQEIIAKLGASDRLLILKKPFDNSEVSQITVALTTKFQLGRQAALKTAELKKMVHRQTKEIITANQRRERALKEKLELQRELLVKQKFDALGALVGGVAHDFNNLLHVIENYSRIAQSNSGVASVVESLSKVLTAAETAKEIVSQVLHFSRTGKQKRMTIELEPAIVSAVQVAESTLTDAHQLTCKLQLPDRQLSLVAEQGIFDQILLNLITNARDAMEDGGKILISVDLVEEGPSEDAEMKNKNSQIQICVTDFGNGIPHDIQKKIMTPLFTTKPANKGTGLGLSTVKSLLHRHGGTIDVWSKIGSGSTFTVHLPIPLLEEGRGEEQSLNKQVCDEPPTARSSNESFTNTDCKPLKILVADDCQVIRALTKTVLAKAGHQVVTVSNGQEAIIATSSQGFDLFVFDVQMPVMDGRTAIRQLRELGITTPVLICSGLDPSSKSQDSKDQSIQLIRKPFDVRELLDAVYFATNVS